MLAGEILEQSRSRRNMTGTTAHYRCPRQSERVASGRSRSQGTTFERADRPRADFAMAEQSSEEAARVRLVLDRDESK